MALVIVVLYVLLGLAVVRKAVILMDQVDEIDTGDATELAVIGVVCFLIFTVWPMFFIGWLIGKTIVMPVLNKRRSNA